MLMYLQMIDGPAARDKFEILYDEYLGLMLYVAENILGNRQDAEDVAHDAFLSIMENLEKISEPKCPKTKTYIATITENKAIDLYRKKQRLSQEGLDETMPGAVVPYAGENSLAQCILKLPARYREWILLKYHQGYTNQELEEILGISRAAIYKLDQRARSFLEDLCRKEGIL